MHSQLMLLASGSFPGPRFIQRFGRHHFAGGIACSTSWHGSNFSISRTFCSALCSLHLSHSVTFLIVSQFIYLLSVTLHYGVKHLSKVSASSQKLFHGYENHRAIATRFTVFVFKL